MFMEVSSINKIDNPKMEKHIIERPNSFLFFLRVFINFLIFFNTKTYKLKYFISVMKITRTKSGISKIVRIWIHKFGRASLLFLGISRFTYKIHSAKVKKYSNDGGYSVYGS